MVATGLISSGLLWCAAKDGYLPAIAWAGGRALASAFYNHPALAIGTAAALRVVGPLYQHEVGALFQAFKTWAIDTFAYKHPDPSVYRNQFAQQPPAVDKRPSSNPHQASAANRSNARSFITLFSLAVGLQPFFYQMSATDQRRGFAGNRTYFWGTDLHIAPNYSVPADGQLVAMVDVDEYVDMQDMLARDPRPHILYTLQPRAAAAQAEDYCFTFDENNNVVYRVAGGTVYRHPVYDYNRSSVTVSRYVLGVPVTTTTYLVDRHTVEDHRDIVLLTPTLTTDFPYSVLHAALDTPLQYLRPVAGSWTRLDVFRKDGLHTSTARVGEFEAATVPYSVDVAIAAAARATKHLTKATVQSCFNYPENAEENARDKAASAILFEYYSQPQFASTRPMTNPVERDIRVVQHGPYEPDAQPNMVAFMRAFVPGAFVFAKTAGNERQAVLGRVVKPASLDVAPPSEFLTRCIGDFVGAVFPTPHVLHPVSEDEVREKQNSPTQTNILEQAGWSRIFNKPFSTFMKAETYAKAGNPRVITTMEPRVKRDYSTYIYSLAAHLKQFAWYGPGKTPREIAARVVEICADSVEGILSGDCTTMDGTIAYIARLLDRAMVLRGFAPAYHAEIVELQEATYNSPAVGTFGTFVQNLFAQSSGASDTTTNNTITTAFTIYLGFRLSGMDHRQAWVALLRWVFAYGDDSLAGRLSARNYERAARLVRLTLKADHTPFGHRGVEFLARVYGPGVWYGDPNSMCDIKRQLCKFHTTTVLPPNVTPTQKLVEKARGYALSDGNTPIIGPFCRRVLNLAAPDPAMRKHEIASYFADLAPSEQYPNEDATPSWMYDEVVLRLPQFDYISYNEWFQRGPSLAEMLDMPAFHPETPTNNGVRVVVADEVVDAPTPSFDRETTQHKIEEHNKRVQRIRKDNPHLATATTARMGRARAYAKAASSLPQQRPKPVVVLVDKPPVAAHPLLTYLSLKAFRLHYADTPPGADEVDVAHAANAVFIAPALEEAVKRLGAWALQQFVRVVVPRAVAPLGVCLLACSATFSGLEFADYVFRWKAPWRRRVIPALVHVACGAVPFAPAVVLHTAWNYLACSPLVVRYQKTLPSWAHGVLNAIFPRFRPYLAGQTPHQTADLTTVKALLRQAAWGTPPVRYDMARKKPAPRKPSRPNPRRSRRLRGRGDYDIGVQDIADPVQRLEAKLDHIERQVYDNPNALTHYTKGLGRWAGKQVGRAAMTYLPSLFGSGDYNLKGNSLVKNAENLEANSVPQFTTGKRGTRIREREYIGDIIASSTQGAFNDQVFTINPTNSAAFPWLSTVASQYQQWEPHGIVFEFVSTSSEFNGSSQALGTVVMATNYNVYDSPFPNKQVMENSDYANSTAPSDSAVHGIECDPKERPTPVMYIETPPGGSLQLSSLGNFQVATQGMSVASVTLGELWVSYDITFYKKQISSATALTSFWQATATTVSGASPLVAPVVTSGSSAYFTTLTIVGTGVNVYFPTAQSSGTYLVYYTLASTSSAIPTPISLSGCTVTQTQKGTPSLGRATCTQSINITASGAAFQLPLANASTTCCLTIVPVVSGLQLL